MILLITFLVLYFIVIEYEYFGKALSANIRPSSVPFTQI